MIRRLYESYVDRLAADRGAWAFFKWFALGVLLQLLFMLPSLPLLVLGIAVEGDAAEYASAGAFLAAFLASRAFLFALPCKTVAERKGLGAPWTWAAAGFVFGQIALGLAAALPARPIETAA